MVRKSTEKWNRFQKSLVRPAWRRALTAPEPYPILLNNLDLIALLEPINLSFTGRRANLKSALIQSRYWSITGSGSTRDRLQSEAAAHDSKRSPRDAGRRLIARARADGFAR